MESDVQGQAPQEQPVTQDAGQEANPLEGFLKIAQAEEGPLRDPQSGRFAKPEGQNPEEAKPETEAPKEDEQKAGEKEEVPPLKFKVKTKTEDDAEVEEEVEADELVRGYMKGKDYSRKTAQLAREREALQAKIKEAVEPKLNEYAEKLQVAERVIWDTLAPEIKDIDWNKLAAEDPAEWARRYQRVQGINARLQAVQTERAKIQQAQQEEAKKSLARQVEEARETLSTKIPSWSNDLYGKVLKAAVKDYGFKEAEVNAIVDPRAIEVLHDAMQFRALKAKPIAENRAAPTTPKVVKPGAGEKPDAKADRIKEQMAKLRKTGRPEDAIPIFARMLAEEEGIK